jgi:hypothetical protein
MADLESALHYILRVEVGKFSVLEGQRLMALKKFVAVLAKVSRARASFISAVPRMISLMPASQAPYQPLSSRSLGKVVHHGLALLHTVSHTSPTLPSTTLMCKGVGRT